MTGIVDLQPVQHDRACVVTPGVARIDHRVAGDFETALLEQVSTVCDGGGRLVIDLSGVEFISSVGLRVLNVALRHTRKHGGEVLLANPGATLAEIFHIARFDMLFGIHDSVDAALAAPLAGQ